MRSAIKFRRQENLWRRVARTPFLFCKRFFHFKSTKSSRFPFTGKSFTLSFTPLDIVVRNLEGAFSVKRDKDNPALVLVSCISRDRHFAANLVNTAMKQFQKYLQE